jgi:flagellar hook assembly protein FlgD
VLSAYATDNTGIADSITTEFDVRGEFGIEWAINYPNPFRRTTTISYLLTDVTDDFVEIKIFTVSGRYIKTLREIDRAVANYREIAWNGTDERGQEVANGVYFARIKAKQGKLEVEKIVKLAKVR